jgi:hypothetical protein
MGEEVPVDEFEGHYNTGDVTVVCSRRARNWC